VTQVELATIVVECAFRQKCFSWFGAIRKCMPANFWRAINRNSSTNLFRKQSTDRLQDLVTRFFQLSKIGGSESKLCKNLHLDGYRRLAHHRSRRSIVRVRAQIVCWKFLMKIRLTTLVTVLLLLTPLSAIAGNSKPSAPILSTELIASNGKSGDQMGTAVQ